MVLLFNGDDPDALALARSTWTDCKTRGFEVTWTTGPRAGIYTFHVRPPVLDRGHAGGAGCTEAGQAEGEEESGDVRRRTH